jgi:hypothetical protein
LAIKIGKSENGKEKVVVALAVEGHGWKDAKSAGFLFSSGGKNKRSVFFRLVCGQVALALTSRAEDGI